MLQQNILYKPWHQRKPWICWIDLRGCCQCGSQHGSLGTGQTLRCSTDVWSVMSTNVDHKYPWIVKHHPVGSEQKDILYEKTRQKKRLVTSDRGGTWRWSSQYDFSPGNCHCCLFPSEWKDHEGCISMTWSLAKVPRDPKGGTRPLLVDPSMCDIY